MRILILGGTKFLGRAIVDAARVRGHELTLFNRGRQDPGAYPDIAQVHGDRTRGDAPDGLGALGSATWDAAIDTAGYLPRDVRASAVYLAPRIAHCTFVSSISVMASHAKPGQDETAPVGRLTPAQLAEVDALSADGAIPARQLGEFYGPLKALCEETLEAALPGRALVVRPGLIVGPYDNSDRFTYWPARFLRGGDVLAPGRPGRVVQFIDVRDLADWIVRLVEARATGTYQATGPDAPVPFGSVVDACARIARERGAPPSRVVWADDAWLVAQDVAPWMGLPLWIPETDADMAGFMFNDCSKARAAGLTFRPLDATIRDTLDWNATRPVDAPRAAGITAEREAELLSLLDSAVS